MAGKKITTKKQESEEHSSIEEQTSSNTSFSGEELEYSQEQLEQAEELLEEVEVDSDEVDSGEDDSGESTKSGSEEQEDEDDEVKRTIFIKDIDYDLREEELKKQMERLGEIVRVTVPLTYDQKRNKGFAYVEFKKEQDAQKALKLDGTELLGRKVMVCQAKPKQNKSIFTLFVKNLNYDTKKEELQEHFEKYGKVFNISLPMDTENTERNKGFCFVEYNEEESIQKAMKAKHVVNDRHLYLSEGNKNEDRNKKRSEDRLYGRKDDDRSDNRRNGGRFNDRRGGDNRRGGDRFKRNDDDNDRRNGGRFSDRRGGDRFKRNDDDNERRGGDRFKRNDDRSDNRKFDRKDNNRFDRKGKSQDRKENSKSSNKIVFDDSE